MDVSSLILVAIVITYIGAIIYIANLNDSVQKTLKAVPNPLTTFDGQAAALRQRSTIVRWMLYGIISIGLVFALLILQLGLLNNSPDALAQVNELEVQLPKVDVTAAVANFVLTLVLVILSVRLVASDSTRQRLHRLIGEHGLYNPESSVHTVAIVLALLMISFTFGQLVVAGGLTGLADSVEISGVSIEAELFTAALMIAAAFLGIGVAIHRTLDQGLLRLNLRLPTRTDVIWGVGVGLGLYGALIVMGGIWTALVPPEQIAQQSAAAQQIANAYNTLPLAFILSLAAAVSEEILFRGALQPVFGLVATSIFFALLHVQYSLTPATIIIFVVGLGLGLLRQRKSTSAAIIAHFVYNFIQLALAILVVGTGS
ncbi:MAG: type II CAAX endopeptidase family protein [Chloroflexota bacterium]